MKTMKSSNHILHKYQRSISYCIPNIGKIKKRILSEITASVVIYLQNHPNADLLEIERQFGSAQQIASSYVDGIPTSELLYALKIRRKILAIVLLCATAIIIIWTIAIIMLLLVGMADELGWVIEAPPIIIE